MAVNVQFSIAVHVMAALACDCDQDITSGKLAASVNTSPSFVRRILAKLSKAGLIETATGKAGSCWLVKDPKAISLLDIYEAVDGPKVFAIHHYRESEDCIVSCHIKAALEKALEKSQTALKGALKQITLCEVVTQVKRK